MKLKGYTEKEIAELLSAVYRGKANGKSVSAVFSDYAAKHDRAKGSVRNFYYELSKIAQSDAGIKQKFFRDKQPIVNNISRFTDGERDMLAREVLLGKSKGNSVRGTLKCLSGGDDKLMLRYQNKYRAMLKNRTYLDAAADNLRKEGIEVGLDDNRFENGLLLKKLSDSINSLVDRIADSVKCENMRLKRENEDLRDELATLKSNATTYFSDKNRLEQSVTT